MSSSEWFHINILTDFMSYIYTNYSSERLVFIERWSSISTNQRCIQSLSGIIFPNYLLLSENSNINSLRLSKGLTRCQDTYRSYRTNWREAVRHLDRSSSSRGMDPWFSPRTRFFYICVREPDVHPPRQASREPHYSSSVRTLDGKAGWAFASNELWTQVGLFHI